MDYYPIFLSVVLVVRNLARELPQVLAEATAAIAPLVADYELVIIDNASDDDSVSVLKQLTNDRNFANLQVYALTKEVDQDTASWAGLENALGDYIAVIDVMTDSVQFLQTMLEQSVRGADSVFATNTRKPPQSLLYRLCFGIFNLLYKKFNGIHPIRIQLDSLYLYLQTGIGHTDLLQQLVHLLLQRLRLSLATPG